MRVSVMNFWSMDACRSNHSNLEPPNEIGCEKLGIRISRDISRDRVWMINQICS